MDEPYDLHIHLITLEPPRYRLQLALRAPRSQAAVSLLGAGVEVAFDMATGRSLAADPDATGRWLADTLFADPAARQALGRALHEAETSDLRVRLQVEGELHSLNWETRNLDGLGAASLRERIHFSRYVPPRRERPLSPSAPERLRALAAVAAPAGLEDYNLERPDPHQYTNLARERLAGAQVDRARRADLETLRRHLEQGYDILYLVAHGRFGRRGPTLFLEDPAGNLARVEGAQLDAWLNDLPVLPRLVVLVSCESGGAATGEGDPLAALGPRLVGAGVPTVIAMQGRVSMSTAGALLRQFFVALADHGRVDRALAAARRAVADRTDAWAPVLFSGLDRGLLWEPRAAGLPAGGARAFAAFTEQFVDFLWQDCWKIDDRPRFLMDALGPANPRVLRRIVLEGDVETFLRRTLGQLLGIDCGLVAALLTHGARRRGVAAQATVDGMRAALETLCADRGGGRALPLSGTWDRPVESLARQPTVFLSYADADARMAEQVHRVLGRHGYAVWNERPPITENEKWIRATEAGLANSHTVLLLVGEETHQDRFVQQELLGALDKQRRVVQLRLGDYPAPAWLEADAVDLNANEANWLPALLARLPDPDFAPEAAEWATLSPELTRRAAELAYMGRLRFRELVIAARYVNLSGRSAVRRFSDGRTRPRATHVPMQHRLVPWQDRGATEAQSEAREFEDAVEELKEIRRAVLLGRPGSGKTTTLLRLASDLVDAALGDPAAPLPLLIPLGNWTDPEEPFADYVRRSVDELGAELDERLKSGRTALLLDGLNEIPADQHWEKFPQIAKFVQGVPDLMIVVTCRSEDYPRDTDRQLPLDQVQVRPLDPARVYQFVAAHLQAEDAAERAEGLYWQIAGEGAKREYQRFFGDDALPVEGRLRAFWLDDEMPEGADDWHWDWWRREREDAAPLLALAANPFMLYMMVNVALQNQGALPGNRGQLFENFVTNLLLREKLWRWDEAAGRVVRLPAGESLLAGLTELAFAMQTDHRDSRDDRGAATAIKRAVALRYLDETRLQQAVRASLLQVGTDVRFVHQLLQEYFVARAMREKIFSTDGGTTRLTASEIWQPDGAWWEPTNWEEATILLAGLFSEDCSPIVDWVAATNPELAARCIVESDSHTPEATRLRLRETWLPRLNDVGAYPDARARAAIGRALGLVTLEDGSPLDNRPGVAWVVRGSRRVPDIEWGGVVPAGRYVLGGDAEARQPQTRTADIEAPYQLACYPVTVAQFDCFVRAGGLSDDRWWRAMPGQATDYLGKTRPLRELSAQQFRYANHPRDSVSWYQAIAFCRWLSDVLGEPGIDLPTEAQWEVAARFDDLRLFPWGDLFAPQLANTNEGAAVGMTTAVGLYPHGAQQQLALSDMSGNVWEWCRNEFDAPVKRRRSVDDVRRATRGGAWSFTRQYARATYRDHGLPADRPDRGGFRLVRRLPALAR